MAPTDPLSTLDEYRAQLQRLALAVSGELRELDKLRAAIRTGGPLSDGARRAHGMWSAHARVRDATAGVLANHAADWRDVDPYREGGRA
jgi:hypothetical protein